MIKHFPDFHPQRLEGERFLQQWHVRFQEAVMGNTIGGMSGHVEHPQVGLSPGKQLGQLPAVFFRHDHVGQEQIDGALLLIQHSQRRFR